MAEGKGIVTRSIIRSDGGAGLVLELFSGDLKHQSESLLVMPTERGCFHAKRHLLGRGGGISGSIITPRRLGEILYDHLLFQEPVLDLSGREILIRGILKKRSLPRLSSKGSIRAGMAKYLAREIGELITSGTSPGTLIPLGDRKGDLGRLLALYLEELDKRDLTDPEQIPWKVLERINERELTWKRMGCHMLGPLPNSHKQLISALSPLMEPAIFEEHPTRTGEKSDLSFKIPFRGEQGRQTIEAQVTVKVIRSMNLWDEVDSTARIIKDMAVRENIDPARMTMIVPSRRDYDRTVRLIFGRYGIPLSLGNDMRGNTIPRISSILGLLRSPLDGYLRDQVLSPLSLKAIRLPHEGEEELNWLDLERLTREGFITGGSREPVQDWIDGLVSISQDDSRSGSTRSRALAWSESVSRLFNDLEALSSARMSIPDRCFMVSGFLERYHFDSDHDGFGRDHDIMIQALRALRRRAVLIDSGKGDHSEFMNLLVQELEKVKVTTEKDGPGVSLVGLSGSMGADLDICFFCGLTSSMLPSGSGAFRILSKRERIEMSIQEVSDRRKELEELAIALNSARLVYLSYHLENRGKPTDISPLIENLDMERVLPPRKVLSVNDAVRRIGELNDPSFHLYDRGTPQEDPIMYDQGALLDLLDEELKNNVERGLLGRNNRTASGPNPYKGSILDEALTESLRMRFGPDHVWSPSRLETYRQCPYSFFAKYVLGIREREKLDPGVPPEKKGSIFHSIAEKFYDEMKKRGRSRVRASELDQAWVLISSIAEDELSGYNYSGPYWEALRDQLLGSDGEEGLLMEFLRIEVQYDGAFRVEGTEVRFGPLKDRDEEGVALSLSGTSGLDSFLLQGSIDRLDSADLGRRRLNYIWDYKTGSRDIPDDSLQVPLYLAALSRIDPGIVPAGGGFYYIRRKGSIRRAPALGGAIWKGASPGDLDRELSGIRESVQNSVTTSLEMIDMVRSGNFSPDTSCRSRWCPHAGICRRRES